MRAMLTRGRPATLEVANSLRIRDFSSAAVAAGAVTPDVRGIRPWVVAQVVACVGPAALLLALGRPRPAALGLFALVALMVLRNLLARRPFAALAVVVGVLPVIMLLRKLVLFHSVTLLLAVGIAGVVLHAQEHPRAIARSGLFALGYCALFYWLLGFISTGDYYRNLRLFEMLFGATALVLLAERPDFLATAMFGLLASMFAIGAALFYFGDRLGMAYIAGVGLGNPISYGLPLALLLLLLTADGSRWLLLERRPLTRLLLLCAIGVLLLLSTSRGSWLVAGVGLAIVLLLNRRHRKIAFGVAAIIVLSTVIALETPRADSLLRAYSRTFSEDRSIANRTSGRSDQWLLFPSVLREMPIWGFGPGSGPEIYAEYSYRDPRIRAHAGEAFEWHSLYQHVAVETGYIGMSVLLVLFGAMLRRNLIVWRGSGSVAPLLGTTGFILIAMTVSGMDAVSGLYLGFGLLRPPLALRR